MQEFNIISFGKRRENLERALESNTIGSALSTFRESVKPGATVFLHCNGLIWGSAKVSSDYFSSSAPLWDDKLYPHRFRISDVKLASEPVELCDGVINVQLRKQYGTGWAYKFIFSPKPLPNDIADLIIERLSAPSNVLP